ncbi:interleukin-2-like protein precursor [Gasterosteus aculeatus]|uniref:Interleukin-2 n=2 Tax=Gasterosteus aculeatus TaxID=69293 RepID=A0AAQ4Q627_GASAC|nr:interleukin-2-like protein precursor [Gasterosteus aculeatus]ABS44954.1 interleukin-2-like protein [Gasterosteus aculeatus]
MEHSLRTALWVFCLFGFLQATPPCYGQGDLGFCFLQQHVKCVNVTFTYPINVQAKCSRDALQVFVQGLNNATTDCQDDQEIIPDTLESLAWKFPTTDSTNCKLQTKESQFEDFVKDLERLVQLINASGDK